MSAVSVQPDEAVLVSDLRVRYGELEAVQGVSFAARAGEAAPGCGTTRALSAPGTATGSTAAGFATSAAAAAVRQCRVSAGSEPGQGNPAHCAKL